MTHVELEPPRKSVELEDPGAHELESSASEDHFSDAHEDRSISPSLKPPKSPVPLTRVERVDDEPSYGEVPGTDAYNKRALDAVPDEVEIVPDGQRSRSASRLNADDIPVTPGGTPIPKTVVERIDADQPLHGETPGTDAYEKRQADAEPDIIIKVPSPRQKDSEGMYTCGFFIASSSDPLTEKGSPTSSVYRSPLSVNGFPQSFSLDASVAETGFEDDGQDSIPADQIGNDGEAGEAGEAGDSADFGDEFDDFEEGGEGDDFGDFDDGFGEGEEVTEPAFEYPHRPSVSLRAPDPPTLDFSHVSTYEEILAATESHIQQLFHIPKNTQDEPIDPPAVFTSDRSHSLWSQLVTPPPLQPPNWVRSRIRRLFLVSLGVPVDLDEILPASKQRKLILPSISITTSTSPDPFAGDAAYTPTPSTLQRNDLMSPASVETGSVSPKSDVKRRGPAPPQELDLNLTTLLCRTTEAALRNLTDEELQSHIQRLKDSRTRADEVLIYWQKRRESAVGDKEAFEGVIENLVMHAKVQRKK